MQYMLMIYTDESVVEGPEAEVDDHAKAFAAFTKEMMDRGIIQGGAPLQPTSTATSVRVRDGKTLTTDGPFAETKEAVAGYYVVECKDLDEAIEVAAKIPAAQGGTIEVRPVWTEMVERVASYF